MKYIYEDLSDTQFETLVVFLCQKLLGIGVQSFAEGPDGGRDAKFVGTAQLYPSTSNPWVGITVIQAKHTNGYNRHFNESDFFSINSDHTILAAEIPKIKKMRQSNQLDNYMLFANRRLTGAVETEISNYISGQCLIPECSISLFGVERLEILLKTFPEVVSSAKLDAVDSPLIVSPDDLSDVVDALSRQSNTIMTSLAHPPTPRLSYEDKNIINNMTEDYAKAQRKKYLKETDAIYTFLADPGNSELQRKYETIIDEFNLKIIAKRKDYQTFDNVMDYLSDLLINRDPILSRNKRLTKAVLFYMYWFCDIGKGNDAEAE